MFDGFWLRRIAFVLMLGLVSLPAAGAAQEAPVSEKPNILFILTDDLDAESPSLMPKLREQMVAKGTTFSQAFVTTSLCCPSRASILTGKYTHNHTVYDNHETLGGAKKFRDSGGDASTIATWVDDNGYDTIMIGKYLNYYDGTYIPPGWDEWYGQMGRNNNHRYNINGTIKYFDPAVYHDTDLFSDWAADYIQQGAGKDRPFFMYLATNAPHGPAIPAERHKDEFSEVELPRPPSFNEADVSDKPKRVSSLPLLTDEKVADMTSAYRNRLRSMLSVDDMIERLIFELGQTGELEDTYIVFTSDNGFHMGQHRMPAGKTRAYEEDIRVPLYVRGPGVPAGRTLSHKMLNIDFAPTFARLAGAQAPPGTDGRSFVSLLSDSPPPPDSWRDSFLVEFYRQGLNSVEHSDAFSALRTGEYTYIENDTGERELYDLGADPYQLDSLHASPQQQRLIDELHGRLAVVKNCAGAECRAADGGPLLATPGNLAAAPSPSGVALDWDDVAGEDLAGYNVYRAESESGPFTMLNGDPLSTSSYDDAEAPVERPSYYLVAAVDTAGNESAPAAASATRQDTTAPAGTIKINGGATYTNALTVELTLSAADPSPGSGVASMRLRNENVTTFSTWEPYATGRSWTLSSTDGTKKVIVQYRDNADNRSTVASDAITLDTTAPTVKSLAPAEGAIDVSPTTKVNVIFSEGMRPVSVNASTVKLFQRGSSVPLAAQVSYEPAAGSTILDPEADLAPGKSYKVLVTTGVRDVAGNQLDQNPSVPDSQNKTWFFTVKN